MKQIEDNKRSPEYSVVLSNTLLSKEKKCKPQSLNTGITVSKSTMIVDIANKSKAKQFFEFIICKPIIDISDVEDK